MSFNNVAIVYVKGNAYRIHFWYMSKDNAENMKKTDIIICPKKRKTKKISKKNLRLKIKTFVRLKILNLINKIVLIAHTLIYAD